MAEVGEHTGRVYRGGLSRGDTPPSEIRTTGAAGFRPAPAGAPISSRCPFYVDESAPFSARSTGMSLDVVRREDVPAGPRKFPKDYQRSLVTEDLPLAQPTLAHPTTEAGMPVPWKFLDKPEMPDVPKSKAETHYPAIRESRRPRDLSLKTHDIDRANARRNGRNCENRPRCDTIVDPLEPRYQLPSSCARPAPELKHSGRCTLDISDIEGTAPSARIPVRDESQYGDPLKCEAEFRAPGRESSHAVALARAEGRQLPEPTPRPMCLTPKAEREARIGGPLEPRYAVPLASDGAGTSLHCRWSEERRAMGVAKPATECQEIGHVEGSMPQTQIRDNGEPFLSLETRDVQGATTLHKVAGLPYTMYGPPGNRPLHSTSLHCGDIEGAQAGTLVKAPKVPVRHSRLAHAGLANITPRDSNATQARHAAVATLRPDELGPAVPSAVCIPAERG